VRIAMRRGNAPLTEDLKQATEVFRTLGNAAVLSGIVGFLIGAIHVMETLHLGLLGPGIAVSIVPLLYGAFVKLLVATPLRDAVIARIAARR
jgi:flagellar motor component MotA